MLEDVRRCGCGEVLVLGDVVSGLDPEGCVRELRALPNMRGVQGNADMYMLTPDLEEWPGRREFPGLVELLQMKRIRAFLRERGFTSLFCGHTHLPFVRRGDSILICNAGSAGMPLDGNPEPSWILVSHNGSANPVLPSVEIRRVDYDVEEIIAIADAAPDYPSFGKAGMKDAYTTGLRTGLHWREYIGS